MSRPRRQPANFTSDNGSPVAPEVVEAIARANEGAAPPYGEDEWTERLARAFSALFGTEVEVFPVTTGTAANALSLSLLSPPFGAIYCHEASHIHVAECGASEFYTGGAKLVPLPGAHGKLHAAALEEALHGAGAGVVHRVQPAAVSLTQASEAGTVYSPHEIREIAEVAHDRGLAVHMDGARFANAVAGLACAPAEVTWHAGVDALTFGATKNGAMAAEAVVLFRRGLTQGFAYRRKRGGHLVSKMRYVSVQLLALLEGGRWLAHAEHANELAARLAEGLATVPGAHLEHPVETNQVFVALPETVVRGLEEDGFRFYRWRERGGHTLLRLVTSFATGEEEVEGFLAATRRHAERGGNEASADRP